MTGRDALQTAQSVVRRAQIAVHRDDACDAANYTLVRQTSGYFNNQLGFTRFTRPGSKRILFLLHSSTGFLFNIREIACRAPRLAQRPLKRTAIHSVTAQFYAKNYTRKIFQSCFRLAITSDSALCSVQTRAPSQHITGLDVILTTFDRASKAHEITRSVM